MSNDNNPEVEALVKQVHETPSHFCRIHDLEIAKAVLARVTRSPAWKVDRILDSAHYHELLLFLPEHHQATTRAPLHPYATALAAREVGMTHRPGIEAFAEAFWNLSFSHHLGLGNFSHAYDEVKKGWRGLSPPKLRQGEVPRPGRWQELAVSMSWVGIALGVLHKRIGQHEEYRPLPNEPIPVPKPVRLLDKRGERYRGYDLTGAMPGLIYAIGMDGVSDSDTFNARGRKILEIAGFCAGERNRERNHKRGADKTVH